jgi:protein-S-isoprenylcysteine O-methyltransferase Ste14
MGKRAKALLGSIAFFWVAPAFVGGYVPWTLSRWELKPPFLGLVASRFLGCALVVGGGAVVVESFVRFAMRGLGTPNPAAPPEVLVVSGLYRYVRNPMYVGVVAAVLGQALVFGSQTLLGYAALLWALFTLFVVLYEEPTLRRRFGSAYVLYRANVRRWWPRARPWHGPAEGRD